MALSDNIVLYSVHYDLDGGEGVANRDSAYFPGETMEVIWEVPTKDGYSFGGWYREDTQMIYNAGDTYILDKDGIVFKAIWYEIPIGTVTFELREGTGDFPPIIFRFDKGFTVPEKSPEKEGYDFYGWYAENGGTFMPGEKCEIYQTEFTLTASWVNRIYTMTFDTNGGTFDWLGGGQILETVSWCPFPIYAPYRDGYNFLYWEDEEGNRYVEGDEYNVEARDMTFMAYWEKIIYYTMTFDADGGYYDYPTIEQSAQTEFPFFTPTKEEYNFLYWIDSEGNTYVEGDWYTVGTEDKTFTAVWEEIIYCDVTFDSNGGSYEYPFASLSKGCEWIMSSPTWEGHTFLYWIDDEGNRYVEGDLYIFGEGQVTMTAIWDTPVYTVKYEGLSNAEIASSSDSVTVTTAIPEKEGHTFVCWKHGENTYNAGDILTSTDDMTLSAQWERYAFVMTYEGIETHSLVNIGDSYVIPSTVPAKEGHDFVCWKIGEESYNAGDLITPTDDMTFEAVWTPRHYTVTFDLNGGTGNFTSLDKTYGVDLSLPENAPTKDGVNFVGWTASDGETYFVGATLSYNGDITLTAVWKCILTFDLNGRTGSYEPVMGNEGESIVLPSTTARAGYNLAGWKNKDNVVYLPGSEYTFTSASDTLTAIWEEITYDVTFDLDGGNWTVPEQKKSFYSEYTLPTSEPTKEKHVFFRWTDEMGIVYNPGDLYKKNAPITLKAQWKEVFTITYLDSDGNVFATQENIDGETITLLSEVPRISDGYFSHWGIEGYESRYFPGKEFSPRRDIVLIPIYNIAYELDLRNGSRRFMKLESAGNGRFYLPTEVPTKEGYDFVCWRNEENGKLGFPGQLYITSGVSEDIYAVFVESTKKMVIYDLDGGTGDFPDQTADITELNTTYSHVPEKEGYIFDCWEIVYANDDTYAMNYRLTPDSVFPDSCDMVLRALWLKVRVTVKNLPENGVVNRATTTSLQLEAEVYPTASDFSPTWSMPESRAMTRAMNGVRQYNVTRRWESSNESIATVDQNGVITPKKTGIVVIKLYVTYSLDGNSFTIVIPKTFYVYELENDGNVFTNANEIDDIRIRMMALGRMNHYYNDNPDIKAVVDGTDPNCNTCIFAFEGLGDPSLKLLDQKDNYELPENQISSVHQQWRYMAMMIVTKGKEIVYVTRRSSTLPDQATSYSYSTTNREKGPTTLKEHIYDYKTGVHFGSYLALVPSDDDRIAWYRNDGVFVCSGSQGTNLHAGTGKASPSNANSTGCQLIHYKDYISFGKAVGFLKDSDEETLNDLTTTGSSLGTNLGNLTGANATNSNPHYNYVEVKYILDRTYDETNGFYSDPKRFEEYAKELSNIEMSSSSTSEDIQKSEDLQRYLSYYDNIDESYKTGIFYPISKQCDISVCETH